MALFGAADIIDRSWLVYRRNAGPILKIVLIFLIPSAAVTGVVTYLQIINLESQTLFIVSSALSLVMLVISLWISVALIRAVAKALTGQHISVGQTLKESGSLILPFFTVSFTFLILTLVIPVVLFALGISHHPFWFGLLALSGIPVVIFMVWFSMAIIIVALKDAGWIASFGKSRALVAGRFFPVLWRLFAPYIFWLLVTQVVVTFFIFLINGFSGNWSVQITASAPYWVQVTANTSRDVMRTLMTPFLIAALTTLYLNLKGQDIADEPQPTEQPEKTTP